MYFEDIRLNFEEISSGYYSITNLPYEILNYVDDVITTISIGQQEKYDAFMTEQLEDYMYSRIITAIYIRMFKHVKHDVGYINIDVNIKNRNIRITLGELNVDEKTTMFVNGIMYS